MLSRDNYLKNSGGSDGCAECCNGDRCDDASHRDRKHCFYCYGTGKPVVNQLAECASLRTQLEAQAARVEELEALIMDAPKWVSIRGVR